MTRHPIFVVGYMHSGTTMLMNVLRAGPGVYASKGETRFFELLPLVEREFPDVNDDAQMQDLARWIESIIIDNVLRPPKRGAQIGGVTLSAEEIDVITHRLPLHTSAQLFGRVFDHLAARANATHWLEKTPTHVFHIEHIADVVPGARFVEIVRDPRDVLASKKTRKQTVFSGRYAPEQEKQKSFEKAFDPLWDSLSWRAAVRAGSDAARALPSQVMSVQYEHMVAEPATTVEQICRFLDLPYSASMLDLEERNAADPELAAGGAISADSVGRYRRVLTPRETSIVELGAGRTMGERGYDSSSRGARSIVLGLPLLAKSVLELVVRLTNRYRLGGPGFLYVTVLNYTKRLRRLFG